MKFKLQAIDDDSTTLTHEFTSEVWYQALDSFVKFLRGCGYRLEDNSVGINEGLDHCGMEYYELGNITTFEQEKEF